jgi:hypothetical protein
MKQIFVLTRSEQCLIIVLILLLVIGAWSKHERDATLQSRDVTVSDESRR